MFFGEEALRNQARLTKVLDPEQFWIYRHPLSQKAEPSFLIKNRLIFSVAQDPKWPAVYLPCLRKAASVFLKAVQKGRIAAQQPQVLARLRKAVFLKIYGRRYDKYVLTDGEAWETLQENKHKDKKEDKNKIVRLQDPTSWKPHQLAIAVLAKQRVMTYQTIEKALQSRTGQQTTIHNAAHPPISPRKGT
jgi:hypothetical protein